MIIPMIKEFLLWSFIVNSALLTIWLLAILIGKNWIYKMHSRFFKISMEQFSVVHYAGIAFYKTTIFVLFIVPYIVLSISI